MRCGRRSTRSCVAVICAALMLTGCAAEPKRPAAKSKPVVTASKSGTNPSSAKKPAVKPAPQKQAKAAAPKPVAVLRTPQERYIQALDLMKAGQWKDAETALAASVKELPQYSGPRTNLGIVYARTNRKPQASAEFTKAVNANPKNAAAHTWLGVLARESGDLRRAEQAYRQALSADSKYADAQLNLAILYDQYLKRPQEALAAYQRYRDLAGNNDLRAAVWVAELEGRLKPAVSTP